MLNFIKFLFLGLALGHVILMTLIGKKQSLRPRAFIILVCYIAISGTCFYYTNPHVLADKKIVLESEIKDLENRKVINNKDLYREYADKDMDAYIYLSNYYETEFDSRIYHSKRQIEKINKYLK